MTTSAGNEVEGGLYYPSAYVPLIIQTHGFVPGQFSMDGKSEWSSGFAARPLASKGFFVLQVGHYKNVATEEQVQNTPQEAAMELAKYESAIDYLDKKSIIDRERVGIIGFSRTFYYVSSALIHSVYHFAAATLVDGIDASYLQFLVFGAEDSVWLNGGSPFGKGLKVWMERSPGFNADKITTPIRLVSTGNNASWLSQWEWFALLQEMRKPVDFICFPDAEHLMVKPWERRVAMQGLVDWFCFWLKDEEDPDPGKRGQYARWRQLRDLQEENDAKDKAAKEKAAATVN